MEVSKRITAAMELLCLGTMLGIKEYTIDSILQNHSNINEAAYQLLLLWRQQEVKNQKEESEMKTDLKNALRSEQVGKNFIVSELKEYF